MAVSIIDLSSVKTQALARAIDASLRSVGFFAVAGHGVPPLVVQAGDRPRSAPITAGEHLAEMCRHTRVSTA